MPIFIGGAILGSAVIGAGASIFGASQQVSAEQAAIQAQQQMLQEGLQTQKGYVGQAASTLQPYIQSGQTAEDWYNYLTGTGNVPTGAPSGAPSAYNPMNAPLTAPFTAANLATTPGYQFTLGQGLKSTQSGFAAQGLGSSGAALKGAADYSTGLASNTYNQQFQNYLTQNQQIANLLMGPASIGANAGGALAGIYGGAGNAALGAATGTGAGIASSTAGIGNAYAGGAAGVAGAASGGVNSYLQYQLMQQLLARQPGATPAAAPAPIWGGGAFGAPGGYGPQPTPYNDYGSPYGAYSGG